MLNLILKKYKPTKVFKMNLTVQHARDEVFRQRYLSSGLFKIKPNIRTIQTKYRINSSRVISNGLIKRATSSLTKSTKKTRKDVVIKDVVAVDNYNLLSMILCPKGLFFMEGYANSESTAGDNPPLLTSIEQPFLLSETEITQSLFVDIMNFDPSTSIDQQSKSRSLLAMRRITWYDAIAFCNKLSDRFGFERCYNISIEKQDKKKSITSASVSLINGTNGFRLPTLKEWEYAAKAGSMNRWSGTNDPELVDKFAVFNRDSEDEIVSESIKVKKPNAWGFYDMTGGVSEWCWDRYESIPTKNLRFVHGGGASDEEIDDLKTASLAYKKGETWGDDLGFRVARTYFG
jgi:formylglycine-generating enzyme required for sulfatase activity